MLNFASLSIEGASLGPALIVVLIVIGITVRVALMVQPGTRLQSYLRLFKRRPPQKTSN